MSPLHSGVQLRKAFVSIESRGRHSSALGRSLAFHLLLRGGGKHMAAARMYIVYLDQKL